MERGAWPAIVHRVTKSQIRLSDFQLFLPNYQCSAISHWQWHLMSLRPRYNFMAVTVVLSGWQRRRWLDSIRQWGTGRPGVLQSTGLQSRTRLSNWTELNQTEAVLINGWIHCMNDSKLGNGKIEMPPPKFDLNIPEDGCKVCLLMWYSVDHTAPLIMCASSKYYIWNDSSLHLSFEK